MARMIGAAALAAALALAGCEDGAPEPERRSVKPANPTSEGLAKLSPLYRNLGLRRAIVENGQRCKRVDRGGYQQDYKNMAMWVAECTDSGEWAVFIAPAGNVQVRRCGNLEQINLPPCKPIPEEQDGEAGANQAAPEA
ncbi:MAG TPA: hypothetical protein VEZ70_01715 [Allosphingosinicella sp.]|nr:hypothetical protein [Allosphingosinicella sp.]